MRPINILITGSNYWNPGDDIVREGVMSLLRSIFFPNPINWLFFNFAAPRNAVGPCAERPNTLEIQELGHYRDILDLVVVPGLAVGAELHDFYAKVLQAGLADKLILIGGMNENQYCEQWASRPEEVRALKQARLIIGRTDKHPHGWDRHGIPYKALPCPSILCDYVPRTPEAVADKRGRVGLSIQLPYGDMHGVVNHTADGECVIQCKHAYDALVEAGVETTLFCHHKSEFIQWSREFPGRNVAFSSWYQDLWHTYRYQGFIVSTRLHAVLWGCAQGVPGCVLNPSERVKHALSKFPFVKQAARAGEVLAWREELLDVEKYNAWMQKVIDFQDDVREQYEAALSNHVKDIKR